jgi:hypothetical protein
MKFLFFYIPLTVLLQWFLIHIGILPYHYGLAFQTVCMILCVPLWALANRHFHYIPRMKLIERASEWFFWKSKYRDSLLVGRLGDHMYIDSLPHKASIEAQRIIAYYEVHGRNQGLTPRAAAYRAIVEFGDAFREIGLSEDQEEAIASAIYYYDPQCVPSRWLNAGERSVNRIRLRIQEQQLAEHALRQVTRDWSTDLNALAAFNPPREAQLVWKGLSTEFEHPQRITERIGVDVGLVAYWAKLLDNFKVVARIGTGYGGGASIRRSPFAETQNAQLVAALEQNS